MGIENNQKILWSADNKNMFNEFNFKVCSKVLSFNFLCSVLSSIFFTWLLACGLFLGLANFKRRMQGIKCFELSLITILKLLSQVTVYGKSFTINISNFNKLFPHNQAAAHSLVCIPYLYLQPLTFWFCFQSKTQSVIYFSPFSCFINANFFIKVANINCRF